METNKTTVNVQIMGKTEIESDIQNRVDKHGDRWYKAYFGGGAHFKNWLEQCRELGEVIVEEVENTQYVCFKGGNEKMYRIWIKENMVKNG